MNATCVATPGPRDNTKPTAGVSGCSGRQQVVTCLLSASKQPPQGAWCHTGDKVTKKNATHPGPPPTALCYSVHPLNRGKAINNLPPICPDCMLRCCCHPYRLCIHRPVVLHQPQPLQIQILLRAPPRTHPTHTQLLKRPQTSTPTLCVQPPHCWPHCSTTPPSLCMQHLAHVACPSHPTTRQHTHPTNPNKNTHQQQPTTLTHFSQAPLRYFVAWKVFTPLSYHLLSASSCCFQLR